MGQIFPSIDGICVEEEEKTLVNDDTIEQSMSNHLQEAPSSLSLRQSQLEESNSGNCQQITINTSYYKQLNRSSKNDSNLSAGSNGHFRK